MKPSSREGFILYTLRSRVISRFSSTRSARVSCGNAFVILHAFNRIV